MSMKGRFPILRTLQYLGQGDIVFKESVKVMTVNYNTHGELGEGARKFVFFNIPQIQYKNPWVQIMMFKNMTPTPFLRFYLDSGEQVLVDVETKSNKEIMEHIKKILGKNEETLEREEQEKKQLSHPAHFGPRKYCLRECICEVEGQESLRGFWTPHQGVAPLGGRRGDGPASIFVKGIYNPVDQSNGPSRAKSLLGKAKVGCEL
ncbi:hypothetical protein EI555_001582 [Monodon monoceros]|uniref:Small ribosomal subunit protein mS25 n=1 Tax=Monodon monoceros TaxID=40151 RepID=A0A4U1EXB0_MONMO|nr:hypothetical protein EI555_001582 [Monodon monoceros]